MYGFLPKMSIIFRETKAHKHVCVSRGWWSRVSWVDLLICPRSNRVQKTSERVFRTPSGRGGGRDGRKPCVYAGAHRVEHPLFPRADDRMAVSLFNARPLSRVSSIKPITETFFKTPSPEGMSVAHTIAHLQLFWIVRSIDAFCTAARRHPATLARTVGRERTCLYVHTREGFLIFPGQSKRCRLCRRADTNKERWS